MLKSLAGVKSTIRLRRAVVAESMIVSAWRRGSRGGQDHPAISVAAGSIITPAARERAETLGVSIDEHTRVETRSPAASAEVSAVIEAVMAAVVAELENRPHARTGAPAMLNAPLTRKLISAKDIELCRFHTKILKIDRKTRVTPLAKDLAEKYGVRIVQQ